MVSVPSQWVIILFLLLNSDISSSLNKSTDINLRLIPDINNTIASYLLHFDVVIDLDRPYDYNYLKGLSICLVYDQSGACNAIDRTVLSYKIGLNHANYSTRVNIVLCSSTDITDISADFESTHRECNATSFMQYYFVVHAPQTRGASLLSKTVIPSEDALWHSPTGLFIGFMTDIDMQLAIGMTASPHMFIHEKEIPYCYSLSGNYVHCCVLHDLDASCIPVVSDFAAVYVTQLHEYTTPVMADVLLALLSTTNGRLLLLSDQLDKNEVINSVPKKLVENARFWNLNPSYYGVGSLYTTLLLVDMSMLWAGSTLSPNSVPPNESILFGNDLFMRNAAPVRRPPSTATFFSRYGIHTAEFTNACLYNRTAILVHAHRDTDTSVTTVISNSDRIYLNQSSSGFYSLNKDSSGWVFLESSRDDDDHHCSWYSSDNISTNNRCMNSSEEVLWFPGLSVAASPPYARSPIHLAQTLLTVVHALHHPDLYPWVLSTCRVILPTIGRGDYPWSLEFVAMLRSLVLFHTGVAPLVVLEEDVQDILEPSGKSTFHFTGSPLHGVKTTRRFMGFDELIILGSTELTSPFVSSAQEGETLRCYSYAWVDGLVDVVSGSMLNTPKECSHVENVVGSPNSPIRVTIISRSENRWIYNLEDVIDMLFETNTMDIEWFMSEGGGKEGGRRLETLSFKEQVKLMRSTDVLIATHGGALINLLFLMPHSVVIEVLTSPWYEAAYQATALAIGVNYFSLPQTNIDRSVDCAFYSDCLGESLTGRSALKCFGLRQCGVLLDFEALEIIYWQAVQSVRILKRDISAHRTQPGSAFYRYSKPPNVALVV